jgi:hypothetical protein
MRVVTHFNPLYHAVEATRSLAIGTMASSWTVGEAFLVMGGLAVPATWWATRVRLPEGRLLSYHEKIEFW